MPTDADALPATVLALLAASHRLLVRADHVAVRAADAGERLAARIPRPRVPYDEL